MEQKFLKLNDTGAYKISFNLSNYVWSIVLKWDYFARDTVGKQLVRAIDSISANVAEGFGRYGKKDKINFYRYSSGSIKESLDWNEKSKDKGLLTQEEYNRIFSELERLPRELNYLIKFTKDKLAI